MYVNCGISGRSFCLLNFTLISIALVETKVLVAMLTIGHLFIYPLSDRLNLPSVLVLNSCGITCAGDENEIAAFCAHVSELDLSDNKLEDWHEVKRLLVHLSE